MPQLFDNDYFHCCIQVPAPLVCMCTQLVTPPPKKKIIIIIIIHRFLCTYANYHMYQAQACRFVIQIRFSKERERQIINFRWRRWGSSLPGLRTLDPLLSTPSTPEKNCNTNFIGISGDSNHFLFFQKKMKPSWAEQSQTLDFLWLFI